MRPALLAVLVVLLVLAAGCSGPVITPPATQVPGTGQISSPTVSALPSPTTNQSSAAAGGSQAGPAAPFMPSPGAAQVMTTTISPGSGAGGSGLTIVSGPTVTVSGPTITTTPGGAPFLPPPQVTIPVPSPPPVTGTVSPPVVPTPGTPLVTPSPPLPQPSPRTTTPTMIITPSLPMTSPPTTIPTPKPT